MWRGCAGVEEGVLVPVPRALCSPDRYSSGSATAAVELTPPSAGWRATATPLRQPDGRNRWLVRLRPPPGARAGRYPVLLMLRSAGKSARLPLIVEVLPFALMRPSKQYSVTRVPLSDGQCCVPTTAAVAELRVLREIGIGSLCLDTIPDDPSTLEETMRAAGLRGPVLVPYDQTGAVTTTAPSGEPAPARIAPPGRGFNPGNLAPSIRWYGLWTTAPPSLETMAAWRAGGGRVACRLDDPGATAGVDLPIFTAASATCARLMERAGPVGASTTGWWEWDAGAATRLENRLRCGALLWKSGLSGALIEIAPDAPGKPDWPLRWEGVRQGVLDSRYLTTLFAFMRQVKDMDRQNRLPGEAEEAVVATLNELAKQPSEAAVERFRAIVVTWINRLSQVVG